MFSFSFSAQKCVFILQNPMSISYSLTHWPVTFFVNKSIMHLYFYILFNFSSFLFIFNFWYSSLDIVFYHQLKSYTAHVLVTLPDSGSITVYALSQITSVIVSVTVTQSRFSNFSGKSKTWRCAL